MYLLIDILLLLVVFCVLAHISARMCPTAGWVARMASSLSLTAIIAGSWSLSLYILHWAILIKSAGWKPFFSGSVWITEVQRHRIFLSDGQIIGQSIMDWFDLAFIVLFLAIGMSGFALFFRVFKIKFGSTSGIISAPPNYSAKLREHNPHDK